MGIEVFFQAHKKVAVAFSGGVDSSVLLLLAKKHAQRIKAYYVRSSFQPEFEYRDALAVAQLLGAEIETIPADVLSDADIVKNSPERCYYCKKRIFTSIKEAAARDGFETVIEGTNASDDISDRPGFRALKELEVFSPLREYGYTKKDIRRIACENRLPVADKPSYACLATRIPTGTGITKQILEITEKSEQSLMKLGMRNLRIRYADGDARLELGRNETAIFNNNKDEIIRLLTPYYKNIYLDSRERTDE